MPEILFKPKRSPTQWFNRLFHGFHFDSVRDVLPVLTVENFVFHSAAEFLCEQKSSIFWRQQKNVAFFYWPMYFFATARGFETHKLGQSINQNTLPPLPLNRFFLPPRFWETNVQLQPGSFSSFSILDVFLAAANFTLLKTARWTIWRCSSDEKGVWCQCFVIIGVIAHWSKESTINNCLCLKKDCMVKPGHLWQFL